MGFLIKSLVLVLNSLEAENLLLHILMCRDLQGLNQFERKKYHGSYYSFKGTPLAQEVNMNGHKVCDGPHGAS
jgi:hypothetical protein